MDNYQLSTLKNFIDSGALDRVFQIIEQNCYNNFKLSIDNPEKISDTINMIRGLKELEAAIQSVVNNIEPSDDTQ